jgi:hypothetical protein
MSEKEAVMALTWRQFKKYRRQIKKQLRQCECNSGCRKKLEPRVDGERPMIDGREVSSACYYAGLRKELDEHPLGAPGIRGRRM